MGIGTVQCFPSLINLLFPIPSSHPFVLFLTLKKYTESGINTNSNNMHIHPGMICFLSLVNSKMMKYKINMMMTSITNIVKLNSPWSCVLRPYENDMKASMIMFDISIQ